MFNKNELIIDGKSTKQMYKLYEMQNGEVKFITADGEEIIFGSKKEALMFAESLNKNTQFNNSEMLLS